MTSASNKHYTLKITNKTGVLSSIIGLFFIWGLFTVLMDSLIPRFKEIFELSYFQAGYVQFAFFLAYGLASIPAGRYLQKVGFKKGIVRGLTIMGFGCILFIPAAESCWYLLFLIALFTLASGMVILQVAANPLIASLGSRSTSARRLTFAQAFNSLGATLGPLVGAVLILGRSTLDAESVNSLNEIEKIYYIEQEAAKLEMPFLVLGLGLLIVAILLKNVDLNRYSRSNSITRHKGVRLSNDQKLVRGGLAIFMYVGAEVAVGSYLLNYFLEMDVIQLIRQTPSLSEFSSILNGKALRFVDDTAVAGTFVSIYWASAMIGRFIGAALMRKVRSAILLAVFGAMAVLMILSTVYFTGLTSMWCILAVGLFNSIMFPTIFAMAIADQGQFRAEASGLMCTAIAGGAVIPLLFGLFVDLWGFHEALIMVIFCYGYIAWYGKWYHNQEADGQVQYAEPEHKIKESPAYQRLMSNS